MAESTDHVTGSEAVDAATVAGASGPTARFPASPDARRKDDVTDMDGIGVSGTPSVRIASLTDFVACRMAEDEGVFAPDSRPPGEDLTGASSWPRLLVDYEGAVPLTEHWARLESAIRALANRFADHPDHDPRWIVPAVTRGAGSHAGI